MAFQNKMCHFSIIVQALDRLELRPVFARRNDVADLPTSFFPPHVKLQKCKYLYKSARHPSM